MPLGITPSTGKRTRGSSEVTGIGTATEIHQQAMSTVTAKVLRASRGMASRAGASTSAKHRAMRATPAAVQKPFDRRRPATRAAAPVTATKTAAQRRNGPGSPARLGAMSTPQKPAAPATKPLVLAAGVCSVFTAEGYSLSSPELGGGGLQSAARSSWSRLAASRSANPAASGMILRSAVTPIESWRA